MAPAEPVTASDAEHPPVVIKLPEEALHRIQEAQKKYAGQEPQGSVPGGVLAGHGEDAEAPHAPAASATVDAGAVAGASAKSKGKEPIEGS